MDLVMESWNLTNNFVHNEANTSFHYVPIESGIFLETPSTNKSAELFPEPAALELPLYIRLTASLLILIILVVGTIGNTMVIIVISCSRDMRTSTNFFLVNLSVADLMVLIFVTPTALIEAIYDPEQWLFGKTMCYIVVPLEMTVCHASVLTILAISFERYLVICTPLKANYVCTRARAVCICAFVWLLAIIITSPMFFMTGYHDVPEVPKPICLVGAGTFWPDLYTLSSTVLLFFVPLILMIVTYALISHKLCPQTRRTSRPPLLLNLKVESQRGRKQVVIMLGAVVFAFFFCLLPFRLLTVVSVVTDYGGNFTGRTEIDYAILFLVRIMVYANSALNPILYSVCSTKFRQGFQNLCGRSNSRREYIFHRNGTFLTLTANNLQPNNRLNPNRSCSTTPNHSSGCSGSSTNKTYLSRSPSTSPELLVNQGLVRKNGIIRRDRNLNVSISTVKVIINPVSRSQTSTTTTTTRQSQDLSKSNHNNPKLSKKFLYAYVSGHKSECMV